MTAWKIAYAYPYREQADFAVTPALQECFKTLTTNLAQMLEPVARDTTDLVVDEIKNAMIEQKKGEAAEKAKDKEAQTVSGHPFCDMDVRLADPSSRSASS